MLTVTGLEKSLGGRPVVDKVSLSAEKGELVSILGPSGCGKTTALRMVAGLLAPDAGEIAIGGESVFSSANGINLAPDKREIGMVFQSYAIWPHYTVYQNIAYPLKLRRMARPELNDRVAWALDLVKLKPYADRYPGELSGGQQQRVALARAIVYSPKLLLLDEPLANLDARVRETVRFEIRALQQKAKITTLYVTHDQSEAMVMSDRVIVMHEGQVAQEGTPSDIYRTPGSSFVAGFVGTSNFIQGAVLKVDAGTYVVRSLAGEKIIARRANGHWNEGDSVLMSVRPEDFALYATVPEGVENLWRAEILDAAYLGNVTIYSVMAAGQRFQVQADPHVGLQRAGETVYLGIAEDRVRIIERAD